MVIELCSYLPSKIYYNIIMWLQNWVACWKRIVLRMQNIGSKNNNWGISFSQNKQYPITIPNHRIHTVERMCMEKYYSWIYMWIYLSSLTGLPKHWNGNKAFRRTYSSRNYQRTVGEKTWHVMFRLKLGDCIYSSAHYGSKTMIYYQSNFR